MALSKTERSSLRELQKELVSLVKAARSAFSRREALAVRAQASVKELDGRSAVLGAARQMRALPLAANDIEALRSIARFERQPVFQQQVEAWWASSKGQIPALLKEARASSGFRRLLSSASARAQAEAAARLLPQLKEELEAIGLPEAVRLLDESHPAESVGSLEDALRPDVGLAKALSLPGPVRLVAADDFSSLPTTILFIRQCMDRVGALETSARDCVADIREEAAKDTLDRMPVEHLRTAASGRLVVAPLKKAGLDTVGKVLSNPEAVELAPGVGEKGFLQLMGAARGLQKEAQKVAALRIDPDDPTPQMRSLVRDLANRERVLQALDIPGRRETLEFLEPFADASFASATHLVLAGPGSEELEGAARALSDWSDVFRAPDLTEQEAWADFLARPAHYYSLLDQLGFASAEHGSMQGELPSELLEAIDRAELNSSLLNVSLRGYQDFAARFALVQKKVIIGDEMGLGKTVEALTLLAHLSSEAPVRSLVVCPAAVVSNWIRETGDKTRLQVHRLHGSGRDSGLSDWQESGGVAVTTFGTLGWLEAKLDSSSPLDVIVVDEAHYVKNPGALRSRRARALVERANYAMLMTGTPLENRVEEFRNLVRYVQPDLAATANALVPDQFRIDVAPAYLRRNQEDVLAELPELVEVDEWLPLSQQDRAVYTKAVHAGSFHGMRQAAMLGGASSSKLQRLTALVGEARAAGRKVVVFSNYLRVLDAAVEALSATGDVFGPITGSVNPQERQDVVDEFSSAAAGAVLVSQIQAGGVGLNIQAASVVVLVEPQIKPTTEWQAIARAHRMGQIRSVQVHRLLSENSVDERMVALLGNKRRLFAEFAAISEMAEGSPDAFDVSEKDLARRIVEAEQQRIAEEGQGAGAGSVDDDDEE